MMKWARDVCVPRNGTGFGSSGRPVPRPFSVLIPHRPTKLLLEPAACKSLKIKKVGSRALASLLIPERGNGGNRAGNRAAAEATLATPRAIFTGGTGKKNPNR